MKKTARIPVSEARKNFADVLELVANGTRVKVTRYNQTLGGIISGRDLASLKACEEKGRKPAGRKQRTHARPARPLRTS